MNLLACQQPAQRRRPVSESSKSSSSPLSLNCSDGNSIRTEDLPKQPITAEAVRTLVGAWIIQLIIDGQLAMGNISVYFVSYYRYALGDLGVTNSTFVAMQPMIVLFATPFFPFGNYLVDSLGGRSRPVIFCGGSAAVAIVLACSLFHFPPMFFAVVYTFAMGMFKGLLQSSLLRAGWSHLPTRKGMVSGIILSGQGFGGFAFGIYAQKLANPREENFSVDFTDGQLYLPASVGQRVPFMLQIMCLTWAIQITIGLLLIRNKPSSTAPISSLKTRSQAPSVSKMVCSLKFLNLYGISVCHLFYGYFFTSAYKQYGKNFINDDTFLTWVGATAALFNGSFKIFWATLMDYFPFRRVYAFVISLEIFLVVTTQLAVHWKPTYLIACWLTFMTDGGMNAMLPALTISQFGTRKGPSVYGFMYSSLGMSSFLSLLVLTTLFPIVGYPGMFAISFCFSLTAAILAFVLREDRKFNEKLK